MTHTKSNTLPCGCEWTSHSLTFCRMHAAAPKLLEALRAIFGDPTEGWRVNLDLSRAIRGAARAAITKATRDLD